MREPFLSIEPEPAEQFEDVHKYLFFQLFKCAKHFTVTVALIFTASPRGRQVSIIVPYLMMENCPSLRESDLPSNPPAWAMAEAQIENLVQTRHGSPSLLAQPVLLGTGLLWPPQNNREDVQIFY